MVRVLPMRLLSIAVHGHLAKQVRRIAIHHGPGTSVPCLQHLSLNRHIRRYCSSHTDQWSSNHTDQRSSSSKTSSIDVEEVSKFNFANDWWSATGHTAALHTLNALRVPFIRDGLAPHASQDDPSPLAGLQVLDVGCGGGILTECLGRLGASITGLDALQENVTIATAHACQDPQLSSRVSYLCSTVEDLVESQAERYDGVVCSEVIEHVHDHADFVASCSALVKPGGSLFFTTMSKTTLSYALGIVAAEQLFRVVPAGSHDWNKFIAPADLQDMLRQNGLKTELLHGMTMNPLTLKWCWIKDTSVNYALHAVKLE